MTCPKCKAKIGIMSSEIILEHVVVNGCRCIICGYWKFEHPLGGGGSRAIPGGTAIKRAAERHC